MSGHGFEHGRTIIEGIDMRGACEHLPRMGVMVQIRNMPEDVHRTMKSRAAQAGMSLSEYLLREIALVAERPTMEELRERLRRRPFVDPSISPADLIREQRGEI